MNKLLSKACLAALVLLPAWAGTAAAQTGINSVPTGADPAGDWALTANWQKANGDPAEGPPEGQFNETAQITSGGTIFVDSTIANGAGGAYVNGASRLEIRDNGVMTFAEPDLPPVSVDRRILVDGVLNVQGEGDFNVGAVTFNPDSTYQVDFTADTTSPLDVEGLAELNGGAVTLDFTAIANPLGIHTIINAGSVENQADNSSLLEAGIIPKTAVSAVNLVGAGPRRVGFLSAEAGGNGTLVRANVIGAISLSVDRVTGEIKVNNTHASPLNLDGFTVESASGALRGSSNLLGANWTASALNDTNRVSQLFEGPDLNTTTATLAPGADPTLGTNLFMPFAPTEFLQETEDITFQYTSPEAGVVTGDVEYVGAPKVFNNLVLTVDASGNATIQNTSPFSPAIEGYRISSESGSLVTGTWDQVESTFGNNWSASTSSNGDMLLELQEDGATILDTGEGFAIGDIINNSAEDLVFEFVLAGGSALTQGEVVYGTLPSVTDPAATLAGDFDFDGDVDGADFLDWQRGVPFSPPSGLDLDDWESTYGGLATLNSGLSASAVPEPGSAALMLLAGLCLALVVAPQRRLCPTRA